MCAGLKRKANHTVEEGNDMVPGGDFKVETSLIIGNTELMSFSRVVYSGCSLKLLSSRRPLTTLVAPNA